MKYQSLYILKKIQKNNFINKNAKKRGMPNKSPLPIPSSFKPKDILSFNRIFSSNPRYIKQQEQRKFNKTNNMFKHTGNQNYMNNYIFGGNFNNNMYSNMSKSFNNRKNDRSHSPFLRSGGDNKLMGLGMKQNKIDM